MKIKTFEMKRIQLENIGEIYIEETSDGINISISEEVKDSIRIGIPDGEGIHYRYWRKIKKMLSDKSEQKKIMIMKNDN